MARSEMSLSNKRFNMGMLFKDNLLVIHIVLIHNCYYITVTTFNNPLGKAFPDLSLSTEDTVTMMYYYRG